jgi:ATPase subunit of ABC transporter with duplicated ATPase domains
MLEPTSDKVTKPETSLPKEEKPKEAVKKIADTLKQFEKKPNTPDRMTSRESFLKRANKEKDPKRRAAIIAALRGRMFQ